MHCIDRSREFPGKSRDFCCNRALCWTGLQQGSPLECKNVRSGANPKGFQGDFRVEIQKTRNQLVGGVSLRGYRADDFEVLAACLFNRTGIWDYVFVESGRLARRPNFPDYLVIMQPVPPSSRGVWKGTLEEALNELSDGVTG